MYMMQRMQAGVSASVAAVERETIIIISDENNYNETSDTCYHKIGQVGTFY